MTARSCQATHRSGRRCHLSAGHAGPHVGPNHCCWTDESPGCASDDDNRPGKWVQP